jgi:hypothetical protein
LPEAPRTAAPALRPTPAARPAPATTEPARPAPSGGPNLFNRVTGLLRGNRTPPPAPEPRPAQAALPTEPTGELPVDPPKPASQAQGEKIDLEIPTFLRRQHSGTQH